MKKNLLARTLRASGRLLLFVGAALGFGLACVFIYIYIYNLLNPEANVAVHPLYNQTSIANIAEQTDVVMTVLLSIGAAVIALICLGVVAKIYNNHMRRLIARIARLCHAQIFTVEIVGTLISWTLATLCMAIAVPYASILTIFAFIINELLFIFAWGAYGQPNYKA